MGSAPKSLRLTITFERAAAAAAALPRHHNDPFDRMLITQAIAEGLRLVSADPVVAMYAADVLLAR